MLLILYMIGIFLGILIIFLICALKLGKDSDHKNKF